MSTILVVDDDRLLLNLLRDLLTNQGHVVIQAITGEEALDWFDISLIDLVLLDMILPDLNGIEVMRLMKAQNADVPVLIMTAYSDIPSALEAMKAGAADYLSKPLDYEELTLQVRRLLDATEKIRQLKRLHQLTLERKRPTELLGDSPATRRIRKLVARIAASEARAVLVSGESGTGKELVARGLHVLGTRREHPFVEINCATVSPTLFESELFGHEKGAFTDAKTSRQGLAEVADHGTLFLDEIGEMSLPLQAKFLRFLEDQHFRRVGGTQDITVDTRVVAATNRDLSRMIQEGAFRKDLYYRLNVLSVTLPPLRERPEDILVLARHFLGEATRKFRKTTLGFTPEVERLLTAYAWPGNVRELRNVIERIVLLETDDRIRIDHLPPEISGRPMAAPSRPRDIGAFYPASLDEVDQAYIATVLERVGGNKTKAAEILGVSRQTLRAWVAPAKGA